MSVNNDVRTVELAQAFVWTCDDCGRDNFERGTVMPPGAINPAGICMESPEQAEAIQEWLESGGSGDFVMQPARVRCRHCNAEFETATD